MKLLALVVNVLSASQCHWPKIICEGKEIGLTEMNAFKKKKAPI